MLYEPGDKGDETVGRAVAADRIAALVACSWPRAELTALAHRHAPGMTDDLAERLADAASNHQRCQAIVGPGQRNIVVHGGTTDSVALDAGLRTAAPLVGVGLDRIVHASISRNLTALEVAARAENSLALLGDPDGPDLVELLD